jgi:hypothetical protein
MRRCKIISDCAPRKYEFKILNIFNHIQRTGFYFVTIIVTQLRRDVNEKALQIRNEFFKKSHPSYWIGLV